MKRFRFHLTTLLKHRKMLEEQAQLRLAVATERLKKEQALLENLTQTLNEYLDRLAIIQTGSVNVETLKVFRRFIDKMDKETATQMANVKAARSDREQRLQELELALKNRKVVEKIKEKRLAQFRADFFREEQKLLDEMGQKAVCETGHDTGLKNR